MERIPDELLARYVNGVNLMPGTLRDQLGSEPTLLVFLRHFGCPFCKETLAGLRGATERDEAYPPVLFFYQGSPIEGRVFLRRYWPEARAIADPEAVFYEGMGVGRGGVLEMFHPGVIPVLWRARAQGLLDDPGERGVGDERRLPGMFLVRGPAIAWAHRARHQADHPPFARIPELSGLAARR